MAKRRDVSATATVARDDTGVRVRRGAKALLGSSRALLVKERHADGSTFWTLPGGGVHAHESLQECLARELTEELDCRCRVGGRVSRFWYAHSSLPDTLSLYTVFDCTLGPDGDPAPRDGVLDYRWVEPADPPPATLPQVRHVLRDGAAD